MDSHQNFQNLKAKFQGLQAGFGELPKKPPLPKGSQLPGLGRANTISESSSPSGALAVNQRGPSWQRQGAPPSPWLPNLGRDSQANPRIREAPRDQQPPWRGAGNAGEKAPLPPSLIPLDSPRTPRKEQDLNVPRRRPLPPLKTLGPQPSKPPLPPGTLHLERFRRKEATHRRATGKKTILGGGTQVTALWKPGSFSSSNCLSPPIPPIPQDPDELYDDVESSPCPPGPKRRVTSDSFCNSLQPLLQKTNSVGLTLYDPMDHRLPGPQPEDDLLAAERTLKDFQQPGLQLWNSWKASEEGKTEEIKPLKPPKPLKQYKEEKAEREFRKKFKFEGDIVTLTRMMIDPNAHTRRGGGRNLAIRRGEILDVIQFTSREQILCRDVSGKYGFVPRTALLPLETEVYDDVSF